MTKFDMLTQAYKHLQEAYNVYTCSRNVEAGLRDKRIAELIYKAMDEVNKQRAKCK